MLIRLDTTSSTPIYAQIVEQIKRSIASGALRPGDSLPSLRETALKLRVNPLTVTRAYRDLEQEGLIETRHGLGSFVSSNVQEQTENYGHQRLARMLDDLLVEARMMKIDPDDLRALLDERIQAANNGRGPFLPEEGQDDE